MRRRLSAVLLAAGLCIAVCPMGAYADETEAQATEQVTEQVTEAVSEAGAEAETEPETAASIADTAKTMLSSVLNQASSLTDEQLAMMMESDDVSSAAIATNWNSVKDELGAFVEVTDAEISADGTSVTGHAKYEKIKDNTDVVVTYAMNPETQTVTVNWEVNYPMGILMERAALNTVMGLGIVFLTLLFLSWLIGKLHYIPDMVEKMAKKKQPAPAAHKAPAAPAAAPAAPAAAASAAAEEDLMDDLELVAVITAAIAASATTTGDSFVVRSIKKANKRNWQRA